MERDFWIERWESNQIGFHQDDYSPHLQAHWATLSPKEGEVFVPMAGKTRDMLWLRERGYAVLGIELSEIAVDAFFAENKLDVSKDVIGQHVHYATDNIQFLCGDFFNLTPDNTINIKAVFDRASMIAMPVDLRAKYAAHMAVLLSVGVEILLVSMEYPEGEMSGPPFSVSESDIQSLFSENFSIELLETVDTLANNTRLRDRGLTSMVEKVYRLIRL